MKLVWGRLCFSEFDFEVVHCVRIIHKAAHTLSGIPTITAGDSPLDEHVPRMPTAIDTEADTAYICPCFACLEGGSIELTFALVPDLVKTSSYPQLLTLGAVLKAQSPDAYCKKPTSPSGYLVPPFHATASAIHLWKVQFKKQCQ